MELKPKIGIDNLKFGMSQTDIISILGEPDKKQIDEDDTHGLICDYYMLKLRLTFYLNENGRLGYIRTANEGLIYDGQKILYSQIEIAKSEIFGNIISEWLIDQYQFFSTHFNEEYWLTLNEDYGEVNGVELGVPFKNAEEYDWPT